MIFKKVPLLDLRASEHPRPLITEAVDKLASSMKEVGLIQPITVQSCFVMHGIAESGYQIVAGHHRVAAARALCWSEIDALVIESTVTLETELIEIDENLCRAELTKVQRTAFTKRRAQIWEALHPEEKPKLEVAPSEPPQVSGKHGGARPQKKGFAAATAEATGQSKGETNKALARADAIGLDALDKITGTSLDKGVELDALAKLPETERNELIARAAAGDGLCWRVIGR